MPALETALAAILRIRVSLLGLFSPPRKRGDTGGSGRAAPATYDWRQLRVDLQDAGRGACTARNARDKAPD